MNSTRLQFSTPQLPTASPAGGVASAGDIFGAAQSQMWFVDNTTAAHDSLVEAYEDLRRDIKAATGQDLGNPMNDQSMVVVNAPIYSLFKTYGATDTVAQQRLHFQQRVNELAAQYPREAVRDWAERDPVQAAQAKARNADENLARLMESRPGWDKYVTAFGGAAVAAMRDPLTIGSLFIGGGVGGGRTAVSRILSTAGREAAVNAGTEATMQPWVQAWREQAGLDSGYDEAIKNIAFAAGLGGAFGAGVGGVREGVNFFKLSASQRAALAPEVRGAIDAVEAMAAIDAQRPVEFAPGRHEEMLTRAEVLTRPEVNSAPAAIALDENQVSRILQQLAPEDSLAAAQTSPSTFQSTLEAIRAGSAPADAKSPRPVMQFIASIGGVDPDGPMAKELAALGISNRDLPGLFKKGGHSDLDNVPLDEASKAFSGRTDIDDGNGYVNRQSFLDALTAEKERATLPSRGADEERAYWERQGVDFDGMSDEQITARMHEIASAEARWQSAGPEQKLAADDAIRRALRMAGGSAPDAAIRSAVDLHLSGTDLQEAVEHALADVAGISRDLPAAHHELEGLGTTPPEPFEDLPPELMADWEADFEALQTWARQDGADAIAIPFDDDLLDFDGLRDIIERSEKLERVVTACGL